MCCNHWARIQRPKMWEAVTEVVAKKDAGTGQVMTEKATTVMMMVKVEVEALSVQEEMTAAAMEEVELTRPVVADEPAASTSKMRHSA